MCQLRCFLYIGNHCLNYAVKLILKDFVSFFDVFKGEAVGNQRGCVNLAVCAF